MKRMQRCAILVIALILLHQAVFSQDQKYVKKNLAFRDSTSKPAISQLPLEQPLRYSFTASSNLQPSTWRETGFFCRQEYKLEKAARIPVKIRLGTYDVAHRLEYGK
jgi:hypothetical protein